MTLQPILISKRTNINIVHEVAEFQTDISKKGQPGITVIENFTAL